MEAGISEFTLKILLIFMPGIICSLIVDTFTVHKERTNFQFAIFSFLYGISSYTAYYGIKNIFPECLADNRSEIHFLSFLTKSNSDISFSEIIYACIISIIMGFIITAIHTHKLHFRIVRRLGITKKFAELDVWGYVMNSPNNEWVTVRDRKNNLMYDGWIQAFSDNSKEAELLLGDVDVYNNTVGEFLYHVDALYLSLDRSDISIEIRRNYEQKQT